MSHRLLVSRSSFLYVKLMPPAEGGGRVYALNDASISLCQLPRLAFFPDCTAAFQTGQESFEDTLLLLRPEMCSVAIKAIDLRGKMGSLFSIPSNNSVCVASIA